MKLHCSKKQIPLFVFIGFSILIFMMWILNHYFFRTLAYDYGHYEFTCWDYSHFRKSPNTTFMGKYSLLLTVVWYFYKVFKLTFLFLIIVFSFNTIYEHAKVFRDRTRFKLELSTKTTKLSKRNFIIECADSNLFLGTGFWLKWGIDHLNQKYFKLSESMSYAVVKMDDL